MIVFINSNDYIVIRDVKQKPDFQYFVLKLVIGFIPLATDLRIFVIILLIENSITMTRNAFSVEAVGRRANL